MWPKKKLFPWEVAPGTPPKQSPVPHHLLPPLNRDPLGSNWTQNRDGSAVRNPDGSIRWHQDESLRPGDVPVWFGDNQFSQQSPIIPGANQAQTPQYDHTMGASAGPKKPTSMLKNPFGKMSPEELKDFQEVLKEMRLDIKPEFVAGGREGRIEQYSFLPFDQTPELKKKREERQSLFSLLA